VPVAVIVTLLALTVMVGKITTGRQATLRVAHGFLIVERKGRVRHRAPIAGARLARWEDVRVGAVGGRIVLASEPGEREVVIAAREVAVAPEECTAPPGARHDVATDAATFGELRAALRLAPTPVAHERKTFELLRNTMSHRGAVWMMAPWMAGIALAAAAAPLGTLIARPGSPLQVVPSMTVALLAMAWTLRRSSRRAAMDLRLELDATHVRLVRVSDGALLGEAAHGHLALSRHNHKQPMGRGGSVEVPVLTLALGEGKPLTITTADPRARWPDVEKGPAARTSLGPTDWPRLLAALGFPT
jgi:hypothetical protein